MQDNKKSYFYIRVEGTSNLSNLDEIRDSLDIISEEMSSEESNYQFLCQENQTFILTYLLKPEKRRRTTQFRRICEKNLDRSLILKYEANFLDQKTFEDQVNRFRLDSKWKILAEPLGVNELYNGNDLIHFNDFDNFFPWQQKIYSRILSSDGNIRIADNRKIISIIDIEGKKGKSSFIKFLCFKNPIEICKVSYGLSSQLRSAAIAAGSKKCYIIDLPRTKGSNDKIEDLLSVIEEIKNGFVTSPMYGKSSTLMMEPPFVIVFSNQPLPYFMLSKDRWECYELTNVSRPDLKRINIQTLKYKKLLKKV